MANENDDLHESEIRALRRLAPGGWSAADIDCLLRQIDRATAVERERCIAMIKHWFGGDGIDDPGYECVREIGE